MKKILILIFMFAMVFSFGVSVTFAGGGQNTEQHLGDIGEGEVVRNQNQVNND